MRANVASFRAYVLSWTNGSGTFTLAGPIEANQGAITMTLGDVDGDNDLDLLIGNMDGSGGNKVFFNESE